MDEQKTIDLSVITPCYKEDSRIKDSLQEIHRVLSAAEHINHFEIIAVNDGSPDKTLVELKKIAAKMPELKVISYHQNRGKGHAVKKGVLEAKGEFVAYIDSDGEIHPEHLIKYFHFAKYGDFDVVIGSKTHPLSATKFSALRKLMSTGYRMINKLLFSLHVKDTQVGVKLFKREVGEKIFPLVKTQGYAFDIEFLTLCKHFEFSIFEAPVAIKHSNKNSSVNINSIVKALTDTLKIRGQITQTIKAIQNLESEAENAFQADLVGTPEQTN